MERGSDPTAIAGPRPGVWTWPRRLLARVTARALPTFVVPGLDVARMAALDLAAAGLRPVPTPRHAGVLLVIGELPPGLARAAAVAYAQMPRPRAVLIAAEGTAPADLPAPDVLVAPEQAALTDGVHRLRQHIAAGAWALDPSPFRPPTIAAPPTASMAMDHSAHAGHGGQMGHAMAPSEPVAHAQHQSATSMEETSPGARPAAMPATAAIPADHGAAADESDDHTAMRHGGMAHEQSASGHLADEQGAGQEDMEHEAMTPSPSPHAGHQMMMDQSAMAPSATPQPMDHGGMDHGDGDAAPMNHGNMDTGMANMDHETMGHATMDQGMMGQETMDHGAMGHDTMNHGGMDHSMMGHGDDMMMGGFMSMVAMTKGLPRSADGLPMEWLEVPFGPLFPGLPSGLNLVLTLDGDTVAKAEVRPDSTMRDREAAWLGPVDGFPERLARLFPLSPVAYRLLATRALAAVAASPAGTSPGEIGALERERAASHLGWLASLASLVGAEALAKRAAALQLALLQARTPAEVVTIAESVQRLRQATERNPLLRRRLRGIAIVDPATTTRGPVARAIGRAVDARVDDPIYQRLEFRPTVVVANNDAEARFQVRLAEIGQSLQLIAAAEAGRADGESALTHTDGEGMASVETPRGAASLHVAVANGAVTAVHLDTPSTVHGALIPATAEGAELADALIGIASLDLSPWEMDQ